MTMSHLLKQTKKCCVKIIRKLSLNSNTTATGGGSGADQSPTNHGHGLNNRITAKYVLHTNCTPTRCKVQPCCDSTSTATTVFEEHPVYGWPSIDEQGSVDGSTVNRAGFRPLAEEPPMESSLPNIPETQNNYKLSRNTKNLPKKRTNITSNKNVNLRKCFRLRSKTFDGPLAAMAATGGTEGTVAESVQQQQQLSRPAVMTTSTTSATTTTTTTVNGAAEREPTDSQTLASNNSSSRLIGTRLDKISKSLMMRSASVEATGHAEVAGEEQQQHHHQHLHGLAAVAKRSKPLFLTSNKHRRSNYNHIDAGDDDDDDDDDYDDDNGTGEFDEVLIEELGEGQARWRRSVYHQDQEGLTLSSIGGASKRQFGLDGSAEQETTLTDQSTVVPSVLERLTVAETAAAILFEKVKYDRTKRYLIDQLGEPDSAASTSPAGSASSIGAFHGLSSSCSSSPFHLAIAAAAAKSEDFVDPWKNYNIRGGASGDKVSKNPWDHQQQQQQQSLGKTLKASPVLMESVSPTPVTTSYTPVRSHWNPFEYSPAHLARLSGQKQHHQQQQHQVAQPKQQQYRPAFQVQTDVWENLNNKHYEIDTDVVWRSTRCSSRRTSASTVETWIDDETFDNSFNEELERRCATLQICE
ncbi:uncharacterized protein LOC125955176 [Anopheles darlingi]|uniref:uncharacterized protein LOC125955176 n=1 Tax=Anopheles darlingi TaxID=43151 RepID=UPI0021000E24|nr:uncharacterized protein LOC125955176 [Anopheles darlingi]